MFPVSNVPSGFSFRTSRILFGRRCGLRLCSRSRSLSLRWDEFDSCAGSIAFDEDLICYATHISLADRIDFVELTEQLPPIAEPCLVFGKLAGEAFVVGEAAQQVCTGASLEACQFFIGDVFVLQPIQFFVNRLPHLVRRMARQRNSVDGEEARVLVAGEAAEALGLGS